MVSADEAFGGAQFILVRAGTESGLVYADHPTEGVSVEADDADFFQLERENLITLIRNAQGQLCGKVTQLGITAVHVDFGTALSVTAKELKAASEPTVQSEPLFQQQGQFWRIRYDGTEIIVKPLKGMGYIADLLRQPGVPVEAVALVGVDQSSTTIAHQPGLDLADEPTIKAVRDELEKKKRELKGLKENDWMRRGPVNECIVQLEDYLSHVQNQHGQARKVAGTAQRARTAVTIAINRAIDHLFAQHPTLGRHLKESIKTGTKVIYRPTEVPDWHL